MLSFQVLYVQRKDAIMEMTVLDELKDEEITAAIPRFKDAWHKTVDGLFSLIELVAEYSDRRGYDKLVAKLEQEKIIKRSVMEMLKSISRNDFLMDEGNRHYLPPAYNTLWALSSLPPKLLEGKKKKNELTPDLKLETARLWKSSSKTTAKQDTTIAVASIRMTAGRFKRHKTELLELLDAIEQLGAKVTISKALL
jgi:hypothetical protein